MFVFVYYKVSNLAHTKTLHTVALAAQSKMIKDLLQTLQTLFRIIAEIMRVPPKVIDLPIHRRSAHFRPYT